LNKEQIVTSTNAWINPPHPGRGKNLIVGGLLGLLAGPIGAGVYLRSLTQLCYAVTLAGLLTLLTDGNPALIGALTGAGWAVGRILFDTPRAPPGAPASGVGMVSMA